jgi:hypothetical protein
MHRTITLALAAPLLLIAASCASPSDEGAIEVRTGEAATQALRSAPDAVTEAGTVSIEMVMEMTVEGQDLEMLATGAMDTDAGTMSMEVDMGAMLRDVAEETGESIPPGFDDPMRIVADGTTMYMQMPFLGALGAPAGWVSVDLAEMGMADALGAGAYDLRSTLETLRGTSGEPDVVGTDEIRGVDTTHYRATVDLAEAMEAAPESARAAFEQLGDAGDLDGMEMVIDIWIDDEGLPRRQQMDMGSMLGSMGLGDAAATVTIDYFAYGEPVDIVIPSPDEVTPFTDLMGDVGGMFGESS